MMTIGDDTDLERSLALCTHAANMVQVRHAPAQKVMGVRERPHGCSYWTRAPVNQKLYYREIGSIPDQPVPCSDVMLCICIIQGMNHYNNFALYN